MTLPQALALALQRHQSGRLADAEALYRQILAAQPNHADALHLLGVIAHQTGRQELAVELIRQAIVLNPNHPAAHSNLGEAYRAIDRLDEAISAYRRALEIKWDSPEALNNLGLALRERGQLDEAIPVYHRALEIKPAFPEAYNNLGAALAGQGRFAEALASFRHALALHPAYPEAQNNLGNALADQGSLDEAVIAFRRALELKPDYPEALSNLGNTLRQQRQLDAAIVACHRALELKPDYAEAWNNLGSAVMNRGELDDAIAAYRRALQIKPDDACAHSNLIFALHFHPDCDAGAIAREHERWNRQFSAPLSQVVRPHGNHRDPERRLRIGYVSADFRDHPVGRYLLPLCEQHDREQFEIFCYSGVLEPDWMTEHFRALAAGWRDTVRVPDAQLAEMIRADEVDILVDLALHTEGNRLAMFCRQPAPVQVAWLGYPGSAGLPGMGYRLTDTRLEPPGDESAWSAEERVRLPDCWCCYRPAAKFPEISALPAWSGKGVTFGALNNFAKINDPVLALWARVLEAVKESRLVMRCPEGTAQERVRAFLGARGIDPARVELWGYISRWDYLSLYQRIDLALDPFPYSGTTTTCEALWMGSPVLTLAGQMPASRAGLSLLSTIGLGELAASSEEDYVRIAVELAGNLPHLADLRATMRTRMQASPLMDAPRFARHVEKAYREMWLRWCKDPSPRSDLSDKSDPSDQPAI